MGRLPSGSRQRFIECVAGRGMPKPLWTSLAPVRERWVIFLWIGICSLLILALLGGNRHQEMGWLAETRRAEGVTQEHPAGRNALGLRGSAC